REEKNWQQALSGAGLTRRGLQREVARNLGHRNWLEKQIAPRIQPNDAAVQRYYNEHLPAFQEPLRLRASHLFLAAPEGYPEEVIKRQQTLIEQLAKRLANGESFPALVAEFSEDEATKKRAGDLGYFAGERMLPEVFAATEKLHPGEISAPVRSRLGFHILRLTESLPPRTLTFEEAEPEIATLLADRKRVEAVGKMVANLR
ncbi:MAG: peptidylprolyl isomerase, partial [Chthoniobacterales bacterium]|nr:peptidylprolyl isomerase [Chthoniobacterales bacterium]